MQHSLSMFVSRIAYLLLAYSGTVIPGACYLSKGVKRYRELHGKDGQWRRKQFSFSEASRKMYVPERKVLLPSWSRHYNVDQVWEYSLDFVYVNTQNEQFRLSNMLELDLRVRARASLMARVSIRVIV